jgi:3-methyladenine DNA glycosylase AlkD
MKAMDKPLATEAANRLSALANPKKAREMAAYMRTKDPFFGVGSVERRRLFLDLVKAHKPDSQEVYEAQVTALWAIPQREGRYLSLDWACRFKDFITLHALPLYERMIREGAWWDTVDVLAAHLVGYLLLHHRKTLKPVIETWVEDECLWIRRTAILAHLKHKQETDETQLFHHCLKLAPEKDFFIRKAIGWILREYSKTSPHTVRSFLEAHGASLSGLSQREASKWLVAVQAPRR